MNDVDWQLWVDRADDVKRPCGFPVAERKGYIRAVDDGARQIGET